MSATSPTSGLSTPVHLSSDSLVNQGAPNHYPASEQLDFDEAIDVGDDHVTTADGGGGVADNGHVTQRMKLSLSDESTEEGRDSVPNYESTTTDNIIDSFEPVDYIESNPRLHAGSEIRYHANGGLVGNHGNGAGPSLPYHRYENWSVLDQIDDGSKKSRVVKRNKGSRVAKVERQRAPYPLPRPGKVKSIHSRPSPLSRKRRYSGRVVRPPLQPANASEETDMAQADEMGEGEGRDDGFIDGAMQEPFKRRSKKRTGGIHSLLPSLGHGSPQSSPSTTPVSRRKISTRKSRLKPRTRRHSKPQLASADISTQESTTQGPCSSDTSEARLSQDEVGRPGPGGGGGGGGGEDLGSDSDGDYEDTRSITPNPRDVGVVRAEPVKLRNGGIPSLAHRDQVSDIQPPPVTVMSSKDDSLGGSASDDNLRHDSNETSDTDLTPLPRTHTHQHWANKKFESDLSTAPFSSETSDMETSGNERVFTTDGGSATDLNPKPSPDSPPIPSLSPSPMGKVSPRQILSGSSGDEVKKNKLSVKSKPISKPSPPPKKVSTVEPSSAGKPSSSAGKPSSSAGKPSSSAGKPSSSAGKPSSSAGKPSSSAGKPSSSAGKPSAVVKKPLHATKSSPLGNKVASAPQKSQKSEGSNNPSRSKSIKVNIPAKPKPPPVPAKPASKPDVKPKPMRSTSVHHSPSRSGHASSQKAKFEGKPRANSVQDPESSVPVMRKIHSENDLGAAKVVVRRSPTMAARKLTLVKEETAERRQSTPPRPNPPSAPLKPTVPLKPRRQQQQPSEGKAKPGEKASEKKGKSTESAQSAKQGTKSKELPPSDSSKTVSSSEVTTSGPSQSPSVSPYTSPNLSKRLSASGSKPALLPKKASVKSHHHRANSDSARLLRKVEPFDIGSSASVVSVVSSTTPNREQSTKEGVRKGESTRSVRSSNMSPEMPASPTDGATSPPPPPIPPRSKVAGRKSSHLELVIPVSDPGSVRSSPTPTDSTQRKKLGAPRRPPPSPPSPLPKRATEAQPTSNELIDSNSRMSQSNSRDQPQRPVSMHGRDIHSTRIEDAPPVGPIHQYAVVNKPRAFKISPEKPRSKTPDFLSRDETAIDSDIRKNSDSELEVHSTKKRTKVVRRESSRRAPPKPPKYDTPDETTGYVPVNTDTMLSQQQKLGSQSPRSRSSVSPLGDETIPPPLPAQPIPKRKMSLQKPASTVSERLRLKDPIYDVIPDLPKKTYKKAKHREYEEIDFIDSELPPGLIKSAKETPTKEAPTESVKSVSESPVEPIKSPVELVRTVSEALPHKQAQKQPQGNYAQLPIEDLRENWKTSPQLRRRAAKSFSCKKSQSLMYRRFSSERLAQRSKLLTIDASPSRRKSLLHRTPSLDRLDDRMGRSLRYSMHYYQDSSSSDEEDMTGIASPVSAALPKPPSDKSLYSSPKSQRTKQSKSVGGAGYFVPPDVEPLYQYINTAEFLRETSDPMIPPPPPSSSSTSMANRLPVPPGVPGAPGQPKQNQLEIARQLSQRKLWCEQPEVITSGILMSLSDEEKKLQEAMFEVISSEATYLRSLDVLIDHFMDDPGMNPNLPEGRRVLDKRQHHVIFSNVREVRDVSARFLSDLELRQKESPVVKNISDIILDYAENHFECYVRYCTNQIYQTRELHDCIENNVMFREYLKRLESKKICQNLNMQSFLLLPMQRITRLPLLILAILNRTPLDYPDQSLVESTLRNVQKLVTACNDGARKMERTEQLHEIHKKLYFGKLKPFPLVSVSRQLERRGTLALLQVEQKLFGKRKITKKPLYLFVFTDYVIIAKKKKDPKGDYLYKVVDHASRALVEVENVETLSGMTFPKPVLGDQDPITEAMWAVSVAGSKHAFLLMLLDNVHRQTAKYLLLASNDTDKTRWLDSLSRQDVEREDEKIYQTWDCPQVQAVFDYKAQQPDELDLQRGDVVKVYRKMADGWYEGEKLRDFQCGWFPSNFTMEIQNEHTRARNLRETHRLNSLLAANDMILSCVQQNPR